MKNLFLILVLILGISAVFDIQPTQAQERFFTPSHQRGAASMAKQNAKITQLNQKVSGVVNCTAAGQFLQLDTNPAVATDPFTWSCVSESDPNVEDWAKTAIINLTSGACASSELLTFNGTELECTAAGGSDFEVDPFVKDWARTSASITNASGAHPTESCPADNILTLNAGVLECVADQGSASGSMGAGLGDLADVTLGALSNNDVLAWDGLKWVNQAELDPTVKAFAQNSVAGVTGNSCDPGEVLTLSADVLTCVSDAGGSSSALALDDLSDVSTAGAAAGKILQHDGTNWKVSDEADPNVEAWGKTPITNLTSGACDVGEILTYDGTQLTCVPDTAGGITFTYTDLTDTPANYTGKTLQLARVNAGETAMEFVAIADIEEDPNVEAWGKTAITNLTAGSCAAGEIITFDGTQLTCTADTAGGATYALTDLTDTPASYAGSANRILKVNAGATGVEFTDLSGVETDPNVESWAKTAITNLTTGACAAGEVTTFDGTQLSCVADAGAAGTDFTDLGDTPANYTGAADKFVKVNAGATALEYGNIEGFAQTAVTNLTAGACAAGEIVTFDGTQLTCVTDTPGTVAINDLTDGKSDALSVFLGTASGTNDNNAGNGNTAVGSSSLQANSTGVQNTAVGRLALNQNTSGNNSALGFAALRFNTGGSDNTAIGTQALQNAINGTGNIAIGSGAASDQTGGFGNIAIGTGALLPNKTGNRQLNIGDTIYGNIMPGSNKISIGTTNTTVGLHVATTDAILVPNGTTAEQPAAANGMIRYNTDDSKFEFYQNGAWENMTTASGSVTKLDDLSDAINDTTSLFLGTNAGVNDDGANNNIGVGTSALNAITSGLGNVAMGPGAMLLATTGGYNTTIGIGAGLTLSTGSRNILLGATTEVPNATGDYQLNIGNTIYGDMTAGAEKLSIGTSATTVGLHVATTDSILFPTGTTAERPAAVNGMMRYNSDTNLFEAYQAGSWDNLVGAQEINDLTDGIADASGVYLGTGAGANNTGGRHSVAVGVNALNAVTIGDQNTAIGFESMKLMDSGSFNVAVGSNALALTTNSNSNTAMGHGSMGESTNTASSNVALGEYALYYSTSGFNVAVGNNALWSHNTGGPGNANNVAVGANAGANQTAGGKNIIIGANQDVPNLTGSSQLNIGGAIYGDMTAGAEKISIGTSATTVGLDVATADAVVLPRGTTAEQPGTPVDGMIRYNTDNSKFEVRENGSWTNISTAASAVSAIDDLSDARTIGGSIFLGGGSGNNDDGTLNNNVGLGASALSLISSGSNNVAVGTSAQSFNTTGTDNTTIGQIAGANIQGGNFNIAIGSGTFVPVNGGSYQLNIGNAIYGDMTAGAEKISIGTSVTTVGLHVATTDAILFPTGTTAEQPGTPVNGMMRYNSDDSKFEFYENGAWANMLTSGSNVFETVANVTRATSGTAAYATDDFVFGSPQLDDDGDGTHDSRMFFDKSKAAFRAGSVTDTQWNTGNIGDFSTSFGSGNTSSGYASFTAGTGNVASASWSTAFGNGNAASGFWSTAFGSGNTASGQISTVMGVSSVASGAYALATGSSTASGNYSFSGGLNTLASGLRSVALGRWAQANGATSFAFGHGVQADGDFSIAFGLSNTVSGTSVAANTMGIVGGSVAIGAGSAEATLDVSATDAIIVARGTSAEQPASPTNGMIRYNTDNNKFEVYENAAWTNVMTAASAVTGINDLSDARTSGQVVAGNLYLGYLAGANDAADHKNVGVGIMALVNNTSGEQNTAVGKHALSSNTVGTHNTSIGTYAGDNISGGTYNITIGAGTDVNAPAGSYQLNIGNAFYGDMTAGAEKLSIGTTATTVGLDVATTDAIVVPRGTTAEQPGTPVNGMIRYNSDNAKFEAYENAAWSNLVTAASSVTKIDDLSDGIHSGLSLYLGNSAGTNSTVGNFGTGVGYAALNALTTGNANTALGYYALAGVVTGGNNTAVGYMSQDNTTGSNNTSLGNQALGANTTGLSNVAVGSNTLQIATTASANVAVGTNALFLTTGGNNTALGNSAGLTLSSGANNIIIGGGMMPANPDASDKLLVGNSTGALLHGDIATGKLGIGNITPTVSLDIAGTDAVQLPDGTTAERPGSPANGMIRYNSDNSKFEAYENGAWADMIATASSPVWENNAGVVRPVSGTVNYSTDDFLFGSPQIDDDGDATHDSRMFFDKSQGAFRVGTVNSTEWDQANLGNNSFAAGHGHTVTGNLGAALGQSNTVSGIWAMGFGYANTASGWVSTALGGSTVASGNFSTAGGSNTRAAGISSFAMGDFAQANGNYSLAFGQGVQADGANSVAIGLSNAVSGTSVGANTMAIVGGNVGIETATPSATLDVSGTVQISGVGSEACNASDVGTIRFVSGAMQVCIAD